MNILIVNQSIIDMCASFFTLLTAVVEVDGTRMSPHSRHDQFVCRTWLTRSQMWSFLTTSTYNIMLMTLERYSAVTYPVWYSNNVSRHTAGGWLRGSMLEHRSLAGELFPCPALDLQLTGDHLCG